jgi:predicted AAA+ superfamily ATPase
VLKRKIYNDLLNWKKESNGKRAILIEGAHRVGKSTIAKEFGKNEYKSFAIIDFGKANSKIKKLFSDGFMFPNEFFSQLSVLLNVSFYIRNTLIIFDEVQEFPRARELIKYFVEDGRYDFLETGSLISIKKNIKNIVIPSEENKLYMHPMDFEEFLWAKGDYTTYPFIRQKYESLEQVGILHEQIMNDFRTYIIVGGMPQAVSEYVNSQDFRKVDIIKQEILNIYMDDIGKLPRISKEKTRNIYNQIPAQLSQPNKKFTLSFLSKNARIREYDSIFTWLDEARLINQFYGTSLPNIAMGFNLNNGKRKVFLNDTGLLITLAISQKRLLENELYEGILFDKLHINEGMIFENVVAQMLTANNHLKAYYLSEINEKTGRTIEVDFLIQKGLKISPIEVKSSSYKQHSSLDKFQQKFSDYLGTSYIIYDRDVLIKSGVVHLPLYMTPFL